MESFRVSYTGGLSLEKHLNGLLKADNPAMAAGSFSSAVLEDVKFRTLQVLSKDNQKSLLLDQPANIERMRAKKIKLD